MDKYIVVESEATGDGISAEEFHSLEAAEEYLAETANKAVLIKVENTSPETTVELDWFT